MPPKHPKCIHELEGTAHRMEKAAEKKEKKKKEEKGKDVKEEWIPKSITEIKEGEKLRLRPLPMHLESLTTYFAATYRTKPREAEETVGDMLRRALSDQIPATGTEEAQAATTPMPYCRVCDLVFDCLDPFLDHINSEDHWALKENDSMPLFDESAEDEKLTVNQELAREFMSPALVDIQEEDEREKEEKGADEEGNRSLVAEGEEGSPAEFKLPLGHSRMNLKVMSESEAEGMTEEERKECFKLAPGESRTIRVVRTKEKQGGKQAEAVEGKKEGATEEGKKEEKKRETPKKEKLIGAILSSLAPKDIVGYRLRQRPCAECAAIWDEYGALIRTTTNGMANEFAFRCHPIHPCVALLNVTMECFRTSLVEGDDEAYRIPSARTIKFPSREQLKELTNDLELEVSVPLSLGDRHAYACTENYQVAMHFRADAMRNVYERFMDACYKRDEEGKPFCCEVCWVLLPTLRHFKVHMLSDAHDKKMGKAPVRQSALYNPLGQMVCFIDVVTLLARKKAKKIEKKEERKEERKQREKRKEEQDQKPAAAVVKKELEVDKEEKKKEREKAKEEDQKPAPAVVKKEQTVAKEEKGKEEDQQSAVARPVVKAVRKKKKGKKEEKREEEEEKEAELSAHTARSSSCSSTSDSSDRLVMVSTPVHSVQLRFVFEEPHGHDGCPRDKKGKPFCHERTTIAALERKAVRIVKDKMYSPDGASPSVKVVDGMILIEQCPRLSLLPALSTMRETRATGESQTLP